MLTVRPRRSWRDQALAQLRREPAEDLLELGGIRDVGVERRLARLATWPPARSSTAPSCSKRARAHQVVPEARRRSAPRAAPRRPRPPARRASRGPCAASRSAVFGPMPGTRPGGASAKRAQACSRVSTTNPRGFSASEATLATSLFGPMPTEAVSPVAPWIDATSRRIAARGGDHAGQVEIGLVEAGHLDLVDGRADQPHDDRRTPRGRR